MAEDEQNGLVPFFYSSILGSTSQNTFDNLKELGPVCKKRPNVWFHVDAAYAGSAFLCPEMRYLMEGIEHVNSFNTNPNKWMLVHFDASALWVDDVVKFSKNLVVDPLYLQHEHDHDIIDRRHMQISLSRRFRALKLWVVFRMYGISGLQEYIRNHIRLAKYFEKLVKDDDRFEVLNNVRCGLVCFRLKGKNELTEKLLASINHGRLIHMIPTRIRDKYVIRFVVEYEKATESDMDYSWSIIKDHALEILTILSPTSRSKTEMKKHRVASFTRSVSRDVFQKRTSSLYDGATPILVVEEDGTEYNVFDEAFNEANKET